MNESLVERFFQKCLVILATPALVWPGSAVADMAATEIYEHVLPSMCAVLALSKTGEELGFGSGFVWGPDRVVTNRHVVAGADHVRVECNGEQATADRILRHSDSIDLVVLRATLHEVHVLEPRVTQVKPGEAVFALGNPLGLTNTITTGIVGGIRGFDGVEYLQLSADINPGNSGGPVVDGSGRLVAVATMGIRDAQGLNFALPVKYIDELTEQSLSISNTIRSSSNTVAPAHILSPLSFRGISLGSPCEYVKDLEHRGQIRSEQPDEKISARYTGKVVAWAELFGREVIVRYECLYGSLVRGEYLRIPESLYQSILEGLIQKYGDARGISENINLQYKARHILLDTKKEASRIIRRLDAGASFSELAKAYSIGPTGPNGGDLGWFMADQMVASFSNAVIELADGAYTKLPIQTDFGWHVILREESRESMNRRRQSVVWDLGDGQLIHYGPVDDGLELRYQDANLKAALEKKEILRAIRDDAL